MNEHYAELIVQYLSSIADSLNTIAHLLEKEPEVKERTTKPAVIIDQETYGRLLGEVNLVIDRLRQTPKQ